MPLLDLDLPSKLPFKALASSLPVTNVFSSTCRKQTFELVFLAKGADQKWNFDRDNTVGLPGGHGEEIVRSFCFFDEEQVVVTVGEDGCVKAWK